jgi:hypothetical protein
MDGEGGGDAADDNASGAAIVMELARILNMPDVETERSVRFVLWNSQETGYQGARAYIDQRRDMQGKEDYPGSGNYPEATWLGLIDLDSVLWDHGMPRADGSPSPEQRPGADIHIEFQSASKFADRATKLATILLDANRKYANGYPAVVYRSTAIGESTPFVDLIPSITIRENERGLPTGSNPHSHQPTDVLSTYSDNDFRLGLNAAQTTLAAIGQLVGARLKK